MPYTYPEIGGGGSGSGGGGRTLLATVSITDQALTLVDFKELGKYPSYEINIKNYVATLTGNVVRLGRLFEGPTSFYTVSSGSEGSSFRGAIVADNSTITSVDLTNDLLQDVSSSTNKFNRGIFRLDRFGNGCNVMGQAFVYDGIAQKGRYQVVSFNTTGTLPDWDGFRLNIAGGLLKDFECEVYGLGDILS